MRSFRTPAGQPVASRTDVFERVDITRYGSDGTPLHDPCVIASLPQPALFHARHINVQIGTKGELTPGMTVADRCRVSGRAQRDSHGGVDWEGFCRSVSERLGRCEGLTIVRKLDTCLANRTRLWLVSSWHYACFQTYQRDALSRPSGHCHQTLHPGKCIASNHTQLRSCD
jgi:hypothetical protein